MELFMIEGKTHFYETEVEWSGAKHLNLAGGKQAATAAGRRIGYRQVSWMNGGHAKITKTDAVTFQVKGWLNRIDTATT
jgi:hypothetical protein